MSRRNLNWLLLVLFLLAAAASHLLSRSVERPNLEFLPEMVHSPAYHAFASNPVFADGKTLQAPVAGTIARGHLPLAFDPPPEEDLPGGENLQSPLEEITDSVLNRGERVYTAFCTPCHGAGGDGNGSVVLRGVPAPPSLLAENARQLKDGQMFVILTMGRGNMSSYAAQISREDRWKVISYIRSLQKSNPSDTATP